jgi:hypothetical protein
VTQHPAAAGTPFRHEPVAGASDGARLPNPRPSLISQGIGQRTSAVHDFTWPVVEAIVAVVEESEATRGGLPPAALDLSEGVE